MANDPMNPYPAREALVTCGVLALIACLLFTLFALLAAVFLLWVL